MSVTLVTDPTEPGFNSFVSLEAADEYFAGVYFGSAQAWQDLDPDDQARLLITASRALSVLSWTGTAVGALAFPRTYGYSSDVVMPGFITTLVCEWAKWLYQDGATANEAPLEALKIGDLDFKFGAVSASGNGLPPVIMSLLQPLSPTYLAIGMRKARSLSMRY